MTSAAEGKVVLHRFKSELLAGNPLGDPSGRDLRVYLPPGYAPGQRLPALLALAGFTGTGASFFNADPLGENLAQRLDRLIGTGRCPPILVVAPDCFTRLGGNQYIDSTATGRYEMHLLREILPFVATTYGVERWGVFGKSSGGFGAITLAMRNPDVFEAFADHSGDSNFELCYVPDFSAALEQYRDAGGPAAWLERFWADENKHRRKWHKPLNVLAMAAHYSPNPSSPHLGTDFPFDLETGEFRWDVWQRWRAWDPVAAIDRHQDNVRKLRLAYVDCGTKDEFGLIWGARAVAKKLAAMVPAVRFEEFDDGHMSIAYRLDVSLPLLADTLTRPSQPRGST